MLSAFGFPGANDAGNTQNQPPSPGSPRPSYSGLSAGLEIRASMAASAQEHFSAALKWPILNALLSALSYFTLSASRVL